jgi:hypothetical protein
LRCADLLCPETADRSGSTGAQSLGEWLNFNASTTRRRGFRSGTSVALPSAVRTNGTSLLIAPAILALLAGTAHAETPAIDVIQAPPPADDEDDEVAQPEAPMPRWVHRPRPGLIVAGAVTYGATYVTAVLLGLATAASGAAEPCDDCRSVGAAAIVPIAGPLLYWWKTPESSRGSPLWWSIWSGAQAVGAGLLIAGLVGHDVLEGRLPGGARVNVAPAFTGQLGAVSLNVGW